MACCIFTAYVMNRIIRACEIFDITLLDIKYNDFEDGFNGWERATEKVANFVSTRLTISGMTCGACVGTIEKAVQEIDGVDRIAVSLPLERATVVYDSVKVTPKDLIAAIEDAGYGTAVGERSAEQNLQLLQRTEELNALRKSFNDSAVLSSLIAGIEQIRAFCLTSLWARQYNDILHLSALFLAFWVQLHDAAWIHRSAWTRGKHGLFTMDTLISLSLLLGLSLSVFNLVLRGLEHGQTYLTSGSFLATVITAGRYLDMLLKKKNVANFTALYKLQSEAALVKVRKNESYIPAVLLRPQEEIVIEPTSVVPCDCYVIEGISTVDQSTMTGEPVPVRKTTGDFLLAGTRNLSRPLVAVVYKEQRDSSLDQLIESIATSTEQKMDGQEGVEILTTYFVSVVLGLTAIGFCITLSNTEPGLYSIDRINIASERAMAILAAACPCALGLATPSAIMAGIDAAWSRGILLTSGARTIDALSKLTHMVMDKTGTLTEGRLHTASAHFAPAFETRKELCHRLLCAAEREEAQSHPVGKAVFQWALTQMQGDEKRSQSTAAVRNLSSMPGKGVSCEVEGHHNVWYNIVIGSGTFLRESGITLSPQSTTYEVSSTTSVFFAIDSAYAGHLLLQDTIRAEAPTVVTALQHSGLHVTMLTGDTPAEAARVSTKLGIEVLASKSLPHEKQTFITKLQSQGHHVAMVGDGINDSPAQAAADVGILLSLSRACMTGAADVIVMSPDLASLPKLLDIARKTKAQARLNVVWVIVYNVVAVGLAMGLGESTLGFRVDASIAGTMMAFSSIGVLGSSLYLRRRLR